MGLRCARWACHVEVSELALGFIHPIWTAYWLLHCISGMWINLCCSGTWHSELSMWCFHITLGSNGLTCKMEGAINVYLGMSLWVLMCYLVGVVMNVHLTACGVTADAGQSWPSDVCCMNLSVLMCYLIFCGSGYECAFYHMWCNCWCWLVMAFRYALYELCILYGKIDHLKLHIMIFCTHWRLQSQITYKQTCYHLVQ